MSRQFWTKKEHEAVLAAVKKATTPEEALFFAQKAAPHRELTLPSLRCHLTQATGKPLGAMLAKPRHEAKKPEQRIEEDLAERRAREKLEASEADRKVLLATNEDLRRQLERMQDIRATKLPKPVLARKKVGGKQRQGCPVMLCSDWHVEEQVDPKTVNGLNVYTLAIAEKRIDEMAEAFAWLTTDDRFDCRTGLIWLGGDLFSGFIHEELVQKNWLSPVQAVKWLIPLIVGMIRKILALCPQIERLIIVCNDGNHGRLTHKMRVQSRTDNSLEWLMYHQIAAMMADEKRVEFQIADGEYSFVDIFGKTHGFFHGDSVKFAGGVGGVTIPLRRGLNELRKYRPNVASWNIGHFHQYLSIDDINANGSMIGITPYSMSKKFAPEPPRQSWYMIDSNRGKCVSAPIWFSGAGG